MPFGLQPTHLILILVVALLIFGPARLPEIGRSFGKMLGEFRSAANDVTREVSPLQTAVVSKQESAALQCQNCAKQIQSGMKFCPECGSAQSAA